MKTLAFLTFGVLELLVWPALALAGHMPHARATLGGTYAQWISALGPHMRNTGSDAPGWHPCPNHTTAPLMGMFLAGRAIAVSGNRCAGVTYPVSMRRADGGLYMPRDAVPHGHIATQHGNVPVYFSKTLAVELPADDFQDCNQVSVKRGLFVFDVHAYQDSGWVLGAGTCTPDP